MRKIVLLLFALLFSTQLFAQNGQKRKLLLIGVDGARSDALQAANTPHLDSLVTRSFYDFDAWHTGITISGPSWSTILTGVTHEKHGVLNNLYLDKNFAEYPYFGYRAKELKPNIKAIQIAEWYALNMFVDYDGFDQKIQTTDGKSSETGDTAVRHLKDPSLDFLFVYFDKVDLTGHSTGFDPANGAYISAIEEVDTQIGRVLHALQSRENYANEDWLILITTDHGGNGVNHGGQTLGERHIWWIGAGTHVKPGQISGPDPGSSQIAGVDTTVKRLAPVQEDIAVTGLHHLIYDTGINPQFKSEWKLDGKSWLEQMTDYSTDRNEPVANRMVVYPNPTSGLTTVWLENPQNMAIDVKLIDPLGKSYAPPFTVVNENKVNVDITGFEAGVYLLEIVKGNSHSFERIVVGE